MSKKITITSNRPWLTKDAISLPKPTIKSMPDWFRDADRFAKNPVTNEYYIGPDKGKIPTFKACPALFDILVSGYMLHTPCDVEFFINDKGNIDVKVSDPKYKDFVMARPPMPQFTHPHGYYQHHFSWYPDWAISLPEGYSAIYLSPVSRYDLPFHTVQGIIDNDVVKLPGMMPFFLQDNFTGIIPAGTPYAQILPFKREDWEAEVVIESPQKIMKKNMDNSKIFRIPNGGVYKNKFWNKRKYE